MCKSASQGGQRCASSTRKALATATADYTEAANVEEKASRGPLEAHLAAANALDSALDATAQARIEHASTPTGRAEYPSAGQRPQQHRMRAAYNHDFIAKGDHLREKNQAVAAALKDATAKKATAEARTASAEVTLDQIEPGDTFYWDGDTHLLEGFQTDPDDPDMWLVETPTMNLSIPKSDIVETVEDEQPGSVRATRSGSLRFATKRHRLPDQRSRPLLLPSPPRQSSG